MGLMVSIVDSCIINICILRTKFMETQRSEDLDKPILRIESTHFEKISKTE